MPSNRRRLPAGGLDSSDMAGRELVIDGATFVVGEDGTTLVPLRPSPGMTREERAAVADMIGAPEINPAGNPYRDGLA